MRTTDPLRKIHGGPLSSLNRCHRGVFGHCGMSAPGFCHVIPSYGGAMICMLRQMYVVCAQCHSSGKDTADIVKVQG